jgi:prepilin peptidase CpaA
LVTEGRRFVRPTHDQYISKKMLELNTFAQPLAKLLASPREIVLVALLIAAAVIDCRTYRIPNWLTFGGAVFGLLYNTAAHGFMAGLPPALGGLGIGLAMLLPLYALRVMGAGDVKLMAMVGAFLGSSEILYAVLFTFIVGGVAALAFGIYRRALRRMTGNVVDIVRFMAFAAVAGSRPTPVPAGSISIGALPYGVSIAVGTIAWLVARLLGFA